MECGTLPQVWPEDKHYQDSKNGYGQNVCSRESGSRQSMIGAR